MTDNTRPSNDLPGSVPECHEEILKSRKEIESLQEQLDWFRRQMFGQKSDKMPPSSPDQQDAFGEESAPAPQEEKESSGDTCAGAAPGRHKHGRRDLAACDNLPIRKRVVHDVAEQEKLCPCCGEEKRRLPSKFSYQVGITRPELYRIEHEVLQYGCSHCDEAHVSTAAKPMQLLERSMADASLLAQAAVAKFADHLPLHRQEVMLRRMGIDITRWTLCGWMTRMGEQLSVLVDEMFHLVQRSRHAHVDETTLPVLAPEKTRTCYLWGVVGGDDAPYTLYQFTSGRGRAGPLEFLRNFKGVLQTDAYIVYEKISQLLELIWAACWAHVRRKFVDAYKLCASADAKQAVDTIAKLYEIERVAKPMSHDERRDLRRDKAAPITQEFFQWLEGLQFKVLPQSPIGKAIAYALNVRKQLVVYLDYGFVGIDNNPVERALRPVVIGRKNYLFAGNETGGKTAAVFYSLIESAKRHGLNVVDYLEDIIRRLPSHPAGRIRELLPDRWQPLPALTPA
jgi:transposase